MLFSLRTFYQDYYEDESDIIKKLKTNLIDQNISEEESNIILKNFYNSYGININLEEFEEINVVTDTSEILDELSPIFINIFNNLDVNQNSNLYIDSSNNNITNLVNLLSNIINNYNDDDNDDNDDDVICTLDKEDKEKLKKYKLDNNTKLQCNICLDNIIENQEVIELPCNHIYHYECINEYLEKYNYKCPCCRIELGKPKYNL